MYMKVVYLYIKTIMVEINVIEIISSICLLLYGLINLIVGVNFGCQINKMCLILYITNILSIISGILIFMVSVYKNSDERYGENEEIVYLRRNQNDEICEEE